MSAGTHKPAEALHTIAEHQPDIKSILSDLRNSHAHTSIGNWCKGATTHQTVAKRGHGKPYHIADFRHADDAQFCDLAHAFVPQLISEIEAYHERIANLETKHREELRAYEITVANREARIADLETALVKEAARTASEKRRADQMSQQHDMQAALNRYAREKLAALSATQPAAQGMDALKEARNTGINHGVCLALQIMTAAGDAGSAQWNELVDVAGRAELERYAKFVEPEEWELGGFAQVERSKNEDATIDAALAAQAKQGGAANG